jgi:hypothetical protein
MFAREKKLDRIKLNEKPFQIAIIERLRLIPLAALREMQRVGFGNPELHIGRGKPFIVGIEKTQHVATWPGDAVKLLDSCGEKRRRHVLQRIPEQHSVECLIGKTQLLGQESFNLRGVGLRDRALPKRLIERLKKRLGGDAMAQVRNELDILLHGSPEIEDRQTLDPADVEEKLLQAAALALKLSFFFLLSARAAAWIVSRGLAEEAFESIGKQDRACLTASLPRGLRVKSQPRPPPPLVSAPPPPLDVQALPLPLPSELLAGRCRYFP